MCLPGSLGQALPCLCSIAPTCTWMPQPGQAVHPSPPLPNKQCVQLEHLQALLSHVPGTSEQKQHGVSLLLAAWCITSSSCSRQPAHSTYVVGGTSTAQALKKELKVVASPQPLPPCCQRTLDSSALFSACKSQTLRPGLAIAVCMSRPLHQCLHVTAQMLTTM